MGVKSPLDMVCQPGCPPVINTLYRKYSINPDWIETGKGKMFIVERDGSAIVPEYKSAPYVKARLCAGDGSFEVDETIRDYWMFRADWLSRKGSASHKYLTIGKVQTKRLLAVISFGMSSPSRNKTVGATSESLPRLMSSFPLESPAT